MAAGAREGGGMSGGGRRVWRMSMIMFVMGRFIGLRRGMMRICEFGFFVRSGKKGGGERYYSGLPGWMRS